MGDGPPILPRTHESQDYDPGPFEHYPFNAEEQRHVDLIRSIAQTGGNLVLKGGTTCCWPTACRASRSTWTSTAEAPAPI